MARRNKLLVPEARAGLDQLKAELLNSSSPDQTKYEVAEEQGITLNKGDNGNLSTRDAGKIGGQIGGRMVKELIRRAQQQMDSNQ
ncbi:Small, acid-soluble spore protein, alpha/beta type [Halobacillus dabanensis]|uniref:Small, acid-soluble spore protein, alpha/beta type n=1 Tax=Halobacillus dabanensis TaxID=240302 RepID=A0A1I3R8H5_HALDA|nr:alpha/beta-type small acid-soluble spore protein [Halobacillus dabanensis]SFJ42435.1 Small, acid-soluble spore protein, alpha/beta type [Halobacillus dabanensis]